MGGFAIETDDPGKAAYIPGSPRLTLTANGIALIAEAGHLPDISKETIEDKSTQNSLAKTLAISQGLWFLLQIIGRLSDRLPMSLLEIHTAAHALCALLVYALWWDKPYDVADAIILNGDWLRPMTAALWMFSYNNGEKESVGYGRTRRSRARPPEIEGMIRYEITSSPTAGAFALASERGPDINQMDGDSLLQQNNSEESVLSQTENDSHGVATNDYSQKFQIITWNSRLLRDNWPPDPGAILNGQVLLPSGFGPNPNSETFKTFRVQPVRVIQHYETRRYRKCRIPIDDVALERWRLAAIAFSAYPHIWSRFERKKATSSLTDQLDGIIWEYPFSQCQLSFVNPRIPDWPWKDLLDWEREWVSWVLLTTCASVYGAIHATAWMHYFADSTQRDLWRYSAIIISSTGPLFILSKSVDPLLGCNVTGILAPLFDIFCMILLLFQFYVMYFGFVVYAAARAYLPIEAFISLRHLPVEVYQNTRWTQVILAIPHL